MSVCVRACACARSMCVNMCVCGASLNRVLTPPLASPQKEREKKILACNNLDADLFIRRGTRSFKGQTWTNWSEGERGCSPRLHCILLLLLISYFCFWSSLTAVRFSLSPLFSFLFFLAISYSVRVSLLFFKSFVLSLLLFSFLHSSFSLWKRPFSLSPFPLPRPPRSAFFPGPSRTRRCHISPSSPRQHLRRREAGTEMLQVCMTILPLHEGDYSQYAETDSGCMPLDQPSSSWSWKVASDVRAAPNNILRERGGDHPGD